MDYVFLGPFLNLILIPTDIFIDSNFSIPLSDYNSFTLKFLFA